MTAGGGGVGVSGLLNILELFRPWRACKMRSWSSAMAVVLNAMKEGFLL